MTIRPELEDLIDAYANGTATPDQVSRVEDAIQEDSAMAAEINFLTAVRSSMKAPINSQPGEFGLERLRRSIDRDRRERRRLHFWRGATAIAASLLVAAGVFSLSASKQDVGSYHLLQGSSKADFQVHFQPSATSIQLQDLFRDLDMEVVSGPSAAGLYRLRLRHDSSQSARTDALKRLREQSTLVEFAELEP